MNENMRQETEKSAPAQGIAVSRAQLQLPTMDGGATSKGETLLGVGNR